jgi:subtilisin family serine protease
MLNLSRPAVFADVVQNGTGLPAAFTGSGTYVGIVDSGLSRGHLDFLVNGNPSSPRVAHWYPDNVTAGVDTEWHGTHVAGIAAGNGFLSGGRFIGMAPGASLLVAKTIFTTVDIQIAVTNLLNFAGTTPAAINLSLGVTTGPHDGTSGFESAIGSLATNGVASGGKQIISAAAGNEKTDREHFQVTLPPFGSVSAPLSLETDGSFIDVWADGADRYTVTATLGSESASAPSGSSASTSSGRISVSNRTDAPPNGATHITVSFRASAVSPATILLERTRNGGSGKVDAYIDQTEGFFTTATEAGTITEPANASNVIAVGSFDTKTAGGSPDPSQGISSFSSLGPTRDGRSKPDLAAPGFILYSAKSSDNYSDAPPAPPTVPGYDNYVILAGTSMSSPHVAGIASLVWQSNPLLTSAQMRERLKRTADLQTAAPDTVWGYGKVNALTAVKYTVAGISSTLNTLPGQGLNLRADEKSSGPFGNTLTYNWAAAGATVTPSTGPSTTFTANVPGDYPVTLRATPGIAPYNVANATIHVNTIPVPLVDGPASDNVGIPVTFTGSGSSARDVGQALTYRWVLVSRPTNSTAALPANNIPNVTLTPDVGGTYEIGLRVDDGLDNSALVTKTFTTTGTAPPQTGGGSGGGGCSVGIGIRAEDEPSSLPGLLLLLLPLGVLSARKNGYRFLRHRRPAATKCR